MIIYNPKDSKTIYQKTGDGYTGAEPTVIIGNYVGMVEIQQEGKTILINKESINDLCKVLREYRDM